MKLRVYRVAPEPNVCIATGVPWCAYEACRGDDGKRCSFTGSKPGSLCEPAVEEMAAELAELRKEVSESYAVECAIRGES